MTGEQRSRRPPPRLPVTEEVLPFRQRGRRRREGRGAQGRTLAGARRVAALRRPGRGRARALGHEVVPIDAGESWSGGSGGASRGRLHRAARARRRGRHGAGAAGDPRHPLHRAGHRRLRALDGQGGGQAPAARGRHPDARLGRVQRDRLPRARRRRRARPDRGRPRLPARRQAAPRGSSLGVRFAATAAEVPEALVAAFSYDDRVLLERHVEGRSWP